MEWYGWIWNGRAWVLTCRGRTVKECRHILFLHDGREHGWCVLPVGESPVRRGR